MDDAQRMVSEFHRAFGIPIASSPTLLDEATCALRLRLLHQEDAALQEAFAQQDVVAIAQALANIVYVVYGTAISCGIEMEPVLHEVHRSHMSKVGVYQDAHGAWVKPAGYAPPHLQPILAAQAARVRSQEPTQPRAMSEPPGKISTGVTPLPAPAVTLHTTHGPQTTVYPIIRPPGSQHSGKARCRAKTRVHERLQIQCPRCRKNFVRRSHRKGFSEACLSWFSLYPFRCQVCGHRFKTFQFRARYLTQVVDRRQYERIPTRLPVTFTEIVTSGGARMGEGSILELALGGCLVQTVTLLPEGTLMSLELDIEASAPSLRVEAALVRSVRPLSVGLEFVRLAEAEHERLGAWIRRFHATQDGAESMPA